MDKLNALINTDLSELGVLGSIISGAVTAVMILGVGLVIIKVLLVLIRRFLAHTGLDEVIHTFIVNTCKVIMLIILMITLLSALGIPTTSLVTVVGACGAAVALALKDSLSNFAGGILIMISKPFKRGDLIETGTATGRVQSIDILYTTLLTLDYRVVTIPNGLLSTQVVTNHTRASRRRLNERFGISYDSDIEAAKKVVKDVIESSDLFLKEPAPVIGVIEHGDSAVMLDVLVWCETKNYYDGDYFIKEAVKLAFDEAGIEIPYSRLVVQMEESGGTAGPREITEADREAWKRLSEDRAGAAIEDMDFDSIAEDIKK